MTKLSERARAFVHTMLRSPNTVDTLSQRAMDGNTAALAECLALLWVALAMITVLEQELGISSSLPFTCETAPEDDPWTFAEAELEQSA